jgi:PEP-CTERM motif
MQIFFRIHPAITTCGQGKTTKREIVMKSTYKSLTVLTTVICAAVLCGALPASASIVSINRDYNGGTFAEAEETPVAVFTNTGGLTGFESTVSSNSSTDLANGITPILLSGTKHTASGPLSVLTDGSIGVGGNDTGSAYFFQDGDDGGTIRLTLSSVARIGQINTYSWAYSQRGPQKYDVYAAGALSGNATSNAVGDAINILANYTLLASVNASQSNGNATSFNYGQWGVSITPNSGISLGDYQNFIFVIKDASTDIGSANDFWREIDIVEAIPEPSTIMLLGVGGLLVWRRKRS